MFANFKTLFPMDCPAYFLKEYNLLFSLGETLAAAATPRQQRRTLVLGTHDDDVGSVSQVSKVAQVKSQRRQDILSASAE